MKQYLIITLIMTFAWGSQAQSVPDTTRVFPFDVFYQLVLQNHPVVKQAWLLNEQAQQQIRLARGGFDPKLQGSWDFKEYKETTYYDLLDVSLKIPVWFPVDPVIGFEQNRGEFVDPEQSLPDQNDNQQIYWGVSLPVGQGLFIDQRRATVQKALIFQEMAEAERVKEINKILLTAAKDYWDWYIAYQTFRLMQQNIQIADTIFRRTKLAAEYGEAAPIDTVQAKISLLSRITAYQQANIEYVQASLQLSNHLWNEEGMPLELTPGMAPENRRLLPLEPGFLRELLELARENHPELRKIRLKDETLDVDERLARENLKPRLDVGYYFLDQPWTANGESHPLEIGDNYKIGVNMAFPLFLRKERAKLGQVRLKRVENSLQEDITEREIINEINAQFTTLVNLEELLEQQEQMVENYELLLQAERLNLELGESDLFKINIQLEKLIEAQVKLIKARALYQKDVASLFWAAGIAHLGI